MHNEALWRLGLFAAVLSGMLLWERVAPRRPVPAGDAMRRVRNLGLAGASTLAVRLLVPLAPVGLAAGLGDRGFGLLHFLQIPDWLRGVVGFILLDLAVYGQHVATHRVRLLWRLHRVHHADLHFDATTGVRFHPLEIVGSMFYKLALVWALGPPAWAVFVFEVALNGVSLFNHGNVRLPEGLDRALRRVVVTPDQHRVHHSTDPAETHSNFGFNLPWWDWLFGTYVAEPKRGHESMPIGLNILRARRFQTLRALLTMPFASAHEAVRGD